MKTESKIALAAAGLVVLAAVGGKKMSEKVFINYYGSEKRLGAEVPRGVRNNNPGNIRITGIKWQNELPLSENTDKTFEQFYSYIDGVVALMKDIRTKIAKYKTIGAILVVYAPPSENKTEAYIQSVSKKTGIARDSPLQPTETVIKELAKAIIEVENGGKYYTDSIINNAYSKL